MDRSTHQFTPNFKRVVLTIVLAMLIVPPITMGIFVLLGWWFGGVKISLVFVLGSGALLLLAIALMTIPGAFLFCYSQSFEVTEEGLRRSFMGVMERIDWHEITKVRRIFPGCWLLRRSFISMPFTIPHPWLIANYDKLRELVELYAPRDNAIRKLFPALKAHGAEAAAERTKEKKQEK